MSPLRFQKNTKYAICDILRKYDIWMSDEPKKERDTFLHFLSHISLLIETPKESYICRKLGKDYISRPF